MQLWTSLVSVLLAMVLALFMDDYIELFPSQRMDRPTQSKNRNLLKNMTGLVELSSDKKFWDRIHIFSGVGHIPFVVGYVTSIFLLVASLLSLVIAPFVLVISVFLAVWSPYHPQTT